MCGDQVMGGEQDLGVDIIQWMVYRRRRFYIEHLFLRTFKKEAAWQQTSFFAIAIEWVT